MSDNTTYVLLMFLFLGWMPILALGKAITMIIEACKSSYVYNNEETEEK